MTPGYSARDESGYLKKETLRGNEDGKEDGEEVW